MKLLSAFSNLLVGLAIAAGGCAMPTTYNLPPTERLLHPGPGVDGPGPGVQSPAAPMMPAMMPVQQPTVQLLFSDANQMAGMQINWDVARIGGFDSEALIVPGRSNFPANGLYRIKLTNVPDRAGVELYPTIEIAPINARTEAFLTHNAISIQLTNEDFDQVESHNYVTKVIYLPDPEFQELAQAGVETLVSTRLDPGVDPIVEADRRGSVMAVIRMGDKDVEMAGAGSDGGSTMVSHPAMGGPMAMGAARPHVSGVTMPQWGMPSSGTPIGLPGPPHIPFGGPAGLRRHTITNHTKEFYPTAPDNIGIHVRQTPGYSYPRPANRVRITEQNFHPSTLNRQPARNMHQVVQ